jgi:mannose/cellobiose epimerase-like protein (N-acyl-D-glucosamine 2-epimerase family)
VYAAASCEPNELFDQRVGISYKSWWVQIEALRTLLAMTVLEPENPRWQRAFEEQWRYLSRNFIDEAHGGFYTGGLDMMSRIRRKIGARVAPAKITRKGDEWKDASHEGRALLYVMERLRAREGATR